MSTGMDSHKAKGVLLDWDGTLRPGFTILDWIQFLQARGIVSGDVVNELVRAFQMYEDSVLDHDALSKVTTSIYAKALKNHNHKQLASLANEFASQDFANLYPFVPQILLILKKYSLSPVIVSGAPLDVITQHRTKLRLDHIIALELDKTHEGIYTGRITSNPGLTESKQQLVERLVQKFDFLLAIGNSTADLPLFQNATAALIVKADNREKLDIGSVPWLKSADPAEMTDIVRRILIKLMPNDPNLEE
jgi:phosphoserine phosphatase